MADITAFGFQLNVLASNTFPQGFNVTEFAQDVDPLDVPNIDIAELVLGLNGNEISWSRAVAIPVSISVVPGSTDDQNLAILFNANRVGPGKASARDVITFTLTYPDGAVETMDPGKIVSGPPSRSIASEGRLKSKTYMFKFANKEGNA